MLKKAFGDNSLGQTQTYDWYKRFKNGRTSTDDDDRSGRKWRTNDWVLQYDNARPHTAYIVQEFLAKNKMAVVPHPPYSPDLAPCDFFPFPKMKIKMKGRRFDTVQEIQAETQTALNALTKKDLQDAFKKWQKRWDRCMRSQGDYFEGDGAE
ncbi:hypothetical protein B7P43_G09729 [Cryptotermes secundus]|uniref:Mos1 transposase HTH domain-containing protein n=1 Tax=Cryptotermes secundus TaxID=105785 RepID=A0A2J7Q0F6_9NEOP|nr:hypothetical protein B7P43_G09729 [Cryptotermes secundus]